MLPSTATHDASPSTPTMRLPAALACLLISAAMVWGALIDAHLYPARWQGIAAAVLLLLPALALHQAARRHPDALWLFVNVVFVCYGIFSLVLGLGWK